MVFEKTEVRTQIDTLHLFPFQSRRRQRGHFQWIPATSRGRVSSNRGDQVRTDAVSHVSLEPVGEPDVHVAQQILSLQPMFRPHVPTEPESPDRAETGTFILSELVGGVRAHAYVHRITIVIHVGQSRVKGDVIRFRSSQFGLVFQIGIGIYDHRIPSSLCPIFG